MYNSEVKKMLRLISKEDAVIDSDQIRYSVGDGFSTIDIYVSVNKVSFRVYGDAYVLAMTKWLQLELKNNEDISELSLECLVDKFDIPTNKIRDAVQILDLVEQVNEK